MHGTNDASEDPVGDPVCWLSRVCPDCGLLVEQEPPAVCERCGAQLPAEQDL